MWEKLKYFLRNDQVFVIGLLVSTAFVSFMLGRESVSLEPIVTPGFTITTGAFAPDSAKIPILTNQEPELSLVSNTEKPFVASKSGSKYHHSTCPGAKQIKPENKIFFATETEAKSAGYTLASNCQF